jgi:hypothetical protein
MLVQTGERPSQSNSQTMSDQAGSVGYFIIFVGLLLSLIAITLSMTMLLIDGLFVAVFGVTLLVTTDTL